MSKNILCKTCARNCEIPSGGVGYCGVRYNNGEKIVLLSYGRLSFLKKEGKKLLVGSFGSNTRASFEENWDTALFPYLKSQEVGREKTNELLKNIGYGYSPEELINYAKEKNCDTIVFQFNEPVIYLDYILDVKDIKVCILTTGYFNPESLKKVLDCVDEINVVFYSTFDKFYMKHCKMQLSVIKENILKIFESGKPMKIFYPLISDENDSRENIESVSMFVKNISDEIPLIFKKFYPSFRMLDKPVTSEEKLHEAVAISRNIGLKNVKELMVG